MSRKPPRLFDAATISQGVGLVGQLQQQALKVAPHAFGPMSRIPVQPPPGAEEEQPEILEGHCLKCKGKKSFQVEGEEETKNGAVRKYGKCLEPGCGTMMSTFVAGAKDGA